MSTVFPTVVIINYHIFRGLKNINLLYYSSGGQMSNVGQ